MAAVLLLLLLLVQHNAVQTSKLNHYDGLPELRRMTVNSDAVSQNALCAADTTVNIIAELLASS